MSFEEYFKKMYFDIWQGNNLDKFDLYKWEKPNPRELSIPAPVQNSNGYSVSGPHSYQQSFRPS